MKWPQTDLQKIALQEKGAIVSGPFGSNISAKYFVDEGIPVIRGNNLTKGKAKFIDDGFAYLTDAKAAEFRNCMAVTDDIVFTAAGSIGQVGIIPPEARHEKYVISNKQLRVRLDRSRANPNFVFAWLSSPQMVRYLENMNNGGAVPLLNLGIIRRIPVPSPPLETQDKIAEVLSAYDDLIDNNRRRIALLEEAARLLYREWFIHFRFPGHEHVKFIDGLPNGWDRRTLGDVVDVVKRTVRPSNFEEHDIHIGLEHIPRRSFTLANWEAAEGLVSGKWRFEEGDILFCKIRPYFHKVGFTMRRGLVSSDALVWRVRDEADWPVVLCATSSDHFVAVASKTVREGSKMPRADWKVLREYEIPKLPRGLLDIFNDSIQTIAAQCKTLALQNRALAEGRNLLLPRLMNGQIAV